MSILLMAAFFFLGIWLGSAMANARWKSNAHYPARIAEGDHFYKTVLISSAWSWEMADIHRDDQEQDDESHNR